MRLLRTSSVMGQRDARTTTEEDHCPSVGSASAYRGPNRAAGCVATSASGSASATPRCYRPHRDLRAVDQDLRPVLML